jgi:hypothetical protein
MGCDRANSPPTSSRWLAPPWVYFWESDVLVAGGIDVQSLFVPYVIRGIGDVLLAVFTPLPTPLALLFIYGLNTSTGMVVSNSTVQGAVPASVRGARICIVRRQLERNAAGFAGIGWTGRRHGRDSAFVLGRRTLSGVTGVLGFILLGNHDSRSSAPSLG